LGVAAIPIVVDEKQVKNLAANLPKIMSDGNYKDIPATNNLTRQKGTYVMALGGQVSKESNFIERIITNEYGIQHRLAGYKWARKEQDAAKTTSEEFLATAEPALAAHQGSIGWETNDPVPEEIVTFGRTLLWKRNPVLWATSVEGQINTAKGKVAMAEEFLSASTHIPCAFYSQVRRKTD